MGRWAQYRHRGRGKGETGESYPYSPPSAYFWWPTGVGARLELNAAESFPDPSWSVQVQWRLEPDTEWTGYASATENTGVIIIDPASLGDTYDMRARWVVGLDPTILSDWSEPQSALIEA